MPSRLAATTVAVAAFAWLVAQLGSDHRWLWCDELLSANFASGGPLAALAKTLRFDVHPPLYYMQLSLWMLLGQTQEWLSANALLWHAATAGLLVWMLGRDGGLRTGALAGLLFAVSPAAVAYSDQLRMYGFLGFLLLWAWQCQQRWLRQGDGAVWLVLSQAAVIQTHAAGLLYLAGLWSYAILQMSRQPSLPRLRTGLKLAACVVASALPAVLVGALRTVSHPKAPDLADALGAWTFLAGAGSEPHFAGQLLALALLLGLLACCARQPDLARLLGCLVVIPLVVFAAASHVLRPVWIERVFVPLVPFVCLLLALVALPRPTGRSAARPAWGGFAAIAALVLVWAVLSVDAQLVRRKGDGYQLAAEALRAEVKPGDAVLVDEDHQYWCLQWCWAGGVWGDPRQAFNDSPSWSALMRRLPPSSARVLGLGTQDRVIDRAGVALALRDPSAPFPEPEGRLFLVRSSGSTPGPRAGWYLQQRVLHPPLAVETWVRASATSLMQGGEPLRASAAPAEQSVPSIVDAGGR